VGLASTVLKSGVGVWVAGVVDRVLQQMDSIVEEESVGVARSHMQLPFQLWTLNVCREMSTCDPSSRD
jgi:hypothetical protein